MADVAAVREALHEVIDPELGINVVDMGMVRDVELDGEKAVVHMVLTSMSCPFPGLFVDQVETAVTGVGGIRDVNVKFDPRPPWTPELISESARHELEIMGLLPTTTWLR